MDKFLKVLTIVANVATIISFILMVVSMFQ